jgi:4-hydroxy-tetrahydrodipicolinate synthase
MPTPFKKNGELDEQALKDLVTYYEGTGLNGLLAMGTAGEFAMMSEQERMRAAEIIVGTAERLETIINVGWASTRESVRMASFVKDIGADCAIAVEPYFYHPTTEGIAKHYLDIAEQADFPIMAYNIPSFAGNQLPVEILDHFEKDERVVGIKDSEGDAAKLQAFIERASGDFTVMVGMDSLVSYGICQGAKGMMVGSAGIAPDVCTEMYGSLMKRDYERAFVLQKKLNHFIEAMQIGTFPASIKYMMNMQGLPGGHVRAPLEDLSEGQQMMVQDHLRAAKVEVEQGERIIR